MAIVRIAVHGGRKPDLREYQVRPRSSDLLPCLDMSLKTSLAGSPPPPGRYRGLLPPPSRGRAVSDDSPGYSARGAGITWKFSRPKPRVEIPFPSLLHLTRIPPSSVFRLRISQEWRLAENPGRPPTPVWERCTAMPSSGIRPWRGLSNLRSIGLVSSGCPP